MKKLFYFIVSLMILYSCSKNEDEDVRVDSFSNNHEQINLLDEIESGSGNINFDK